jgi:site-specific recombinase XerD
MNTQQTLTFDDGLHSFLQTLTAANKSAATMAAYQTDIRQFLTWLSENTLVAGTPAQVVRADITEYLAHLAERHLSGLSRARKLAAIREYFRHLVSIEALSTSPATTIPTPKKEKKETTFLSRTEYTQILALAGGNVRDFAILQAFLQLGLRVSELATLKIDAVDLTNREVRVQPSKGGRARIIELEKKAAAAIKRYLALRPDTGYDELFLNQYHQPFTRQGIAKLVKKYLTAAGITKPASVHSLRHTFATHKAMRGVSPYRLQSWLGHASLDTTQIYVHLGRENAQREMEQSSL